MREAFVKTLFEEARRNPKICLLTADLGYTVFEKFQAEFPDRFINVGVAEANMMGIAAGLAATGRIPVVYSIANFSVLRPFEQIRNDICFPKHNVKIVGVGAGLAYGTAGFTHHSTEDVALMRSLSQVNIFCPSGPRETASCTRAMLNLPGPAYLRLSKKGEADLFPNENEFQPGKARVLREGGDLSFLGYGTLLQNALKCAELLSKNHQIDANIVNFHTVHPLDTETIIRFAKKSRLIVTLEEHGIVGGLGSAVAEVLSERNDLSVQLLRCGIVDKFGARTGSREYLLERSGLLPSQLEEKILRFLLPAKRP